MASTMHPWAAWPLKALAVLAGLAVAAVCTLLLLVAISLAVAYPNLPETSSLTDYRPKLPLRVYSSDGVMIGEFGDAQLLHHFDRQCA